MFKNARLSCLTSLSDTHPCLASRPSRKVYAVQLKPGSASGLGAFDRRLETGERVAE